MSSPDQPNRDVASSCGALHQPLASPMLDDPRPFYARARAEEPVFWSDALAMWVVTRYEDVQAVARDAARFSSINSISPVSVMPPPPLLEVLMQGFPVTPSLVDSDPPVHTRSRSLVTKALSLRRIATFEPILRELAERLIDRFVDQGQVEFVGAFAVPLPGNFIVDLLGLPRDHLEQVDAWISHAAAIFAGHGTLEELVEHARHFVTFQHYLADAVRDRRQNPRDDALSDIVTGADALDPPLGMAEMINMLVQTLFAGYETTAGMISAAAVELARDPELFAALRDDPGRIPAVIEESLRSASPIHAMYRTAKEDVELGGVTIRAGERLQLAFISANHDEERFEEPLRFDPGRTTPHLAFGQGPHFCIGAPLARLEGRIALEVITQRLPGLRLVPGQRLAFFPSATARRLAAVELAWDPPTTSASA
ncbi:MAG: cytochrome P450 [Myxococcales bacterium]|nr:cytochrome P450 [Myxococcales bacterium]MCB9706822.1 cytochrome P450 [Myxococcales bacterium]